MAGPEDVPETVLATGGLKRTTPGSDAPSGAGADAVSAAEVSEEPAKRQKTEEAAHRASEAAAPEPVAPTGITE